MSNLRTKLIRLAADMPPKSEARRALLSTLSIRDASASGPSPKGRNWRKREVAEITHWVWDNPSDDGNIVRMKILQSDRVMTKLRGSQYFVMFIKTRDGVQHKSPNSTSEKSLFKMGAEIYESGVDPYTLSDWTRLKTPKK